ncbi:MAG: hypothetical protein AB1513_08945 [Pseudomonadota bacterium]
MGVKTVQTVNIDPTNTIVLTTSHSWAAGDPLFLKSTGAMIGGVTAGQVYYAASANLNAANGVVSLTSMPDGSGTPISLTNAGAGTITVYDHIARVTDTITSGDGMVLCDNAVEVSNVRLASQLIVKVADINDTPLTGYEWRLYVDDPAAGIIGSKEIAGEESTAESQHTITVPPWAGGSLKLQIIKNGYEESITPVTLASGDRQTVTVRLESDLNI